VAFVVEHERVRSSTETANEKGAKIQLYNTTPKAQIYSTIMERTECDICSFPILFNADILLRHSHAEKLHLASLVFDKSQTKKLSKNEKTMFIFFQSRYRATLPKPNKCKVVDKNNTNTSAFDKLFKTSNINNVKYC